MTNISAMIFHIFCPGIFAGGKFVAGKIRLAENLLCGKFSARKFAEWKFHRRKNSPREKFTAEKFAAWIIIQFIFLINQLQTSFCPRPRPDLQTSFRPAGLESEVRVS